jgi:hypothetical protein
MDIVNAIGKVRFNSARPQRVQLSKSGPLVSDVLCLEPGQRLSAGGHCVYYIISGSGSIVSGPEKQALAMGGFACMDGSHAIVNDSEQRLICLAVAG